MPSASELLGVGVQHRNASPRELVSLLAAASGVHEKMCRRLIVRVGDQAQQSLKLAAPRVEADEQERVGSVGRLHDAAPQRSLGPLALDLIAGEHPAVAQLERAVELEDEPFAAHEVGPRDREARPVPQERALEQAIEVGGVDRSELAGEGRERPREARRRAAAIGQAIFDFTLEFRTEAAAHETERLADVATREPLGRHAAVELGVALAGQVEELSGELLGARQLRRSRQRRANAHDQLTTLVGLSELARDHAAQPRSAPRTSGLAAASAGGSASPTWLQHFLVAAFWVAARWRTT
jgi:hypothetical protein